MWVDQAAMAVAPYLPRRVKTLARQWLFKHRHPSHLGLKGVGVVQDLYYWVSDGRLDTLLPIQNFFSVFFPNQDTTTTGFLEIFSHAGKKLARKEFEVPHMGCLKLRLSNVLRENGLELEKDSGFGTLICNLSVPPQVRELVEKDQPFYFWDRFYIGYVNQVGQPTFVHGVDKTFIYHSGDQDPERWYLPARDYKWAPEIPVNIQDYEKFTVIVVNRVSKPKQVKLVVADTSDLRRDWEATIQPNGVHRFELTSSNTSGLNPEELRLRIEGMSTQWGRPLVFKEFASGAISVMHC